MLLSLFLFTPSTPCLYNKNCITTFTMLLHVRAAPARGFALILLNTANFKEVLYSLWGFLDPAIKHEVTYSTASLSMRMVHVHTHIRVVCTCTCICTYTPPAPTIVVHTRLWADACMSLSSSMCICSRAGDLYLCASVRHAAIKVRLESSWDWAVTELRVLLYCSYSAGTLVHDG